MRISTASMYDDGVRNIQDRQEQLNRLQTQLNTGKRILKPSDDPVASARGLEIEQLKNANGQYSKNSQTASDALALMESSMQSATDVLQSIREKMVQGGNGVLNSQDRETIAKEVDSAFQQLLGVANTKNSNGEYIFSGFSGNVKPFVENAPGQVSYYGDQGQRTYQVTPSRQLPVSENGFKVFEKISPGNGVFTTSAANANTGTGVIDTGNVTDASLLTGHNYELTFSVDSSSGTNITTFSVVDTVSNTTVLANQAYLPNTAVNFDGVQFTLQGAPADGDQFSVQPAVNQSVFTTLDQLRQALRAPQTTDQEKTAFKNNFSKAVTALDQALNHTIDTQATLGAYGKEADLSFNLAEDLNTQYSLQLTKLLELDFVEAISDFSQEKIFLEAAQKTFVQIQGLSLFDFIN